MSLPVIIITHVSVCPMFIVMLDSGLLLTAVVVGDQNQSTLLKIWMPYTQTCKIRSSVILFVSNAQCLFKGCCYSGGGGGGGICIRITSHLESALNSILGLRALLHQQNCK